ncbi:MAG: adenosylmethionine decarboxylase [Alphaproteobacteria bacterium]|nr:adenosylmethionine decarboxylase [Alphaproteobacteria bacterium]
MKALHDLGMDLEATACPSDIPHNAEPQGGDKPSADIVPFTQSHENLDHFIHKDGEVFAGTHLIIDLWGADRLDDIDHISAALRECVEKAKATLLHIHLHHFTPNGGVSGVAVLAESHISIHTWPEKNYAALDVFMCGDSEPHRAIDVLKEAFGPDSVEVGEHRRGKVL